MKKVRNEEAEGVEKERRGKKLELLLANFLRDSARVESTTIKHRSQLLAISIMEGNPSFFFCLFVLLAAKRSGWDKKKKNNTIFEGRNQNLGRGFSLVLSLLFSLPESPKKIDPLSAPDY